SGERSSLSAWSTDNRLQAEFDTGELEHRVTLGAEYHRYKNEITAAGGSAKQLNARTGEQVGDMPDYTWADKTRRYYQTGLYLQDEMKLD
ncbi:TonB-dependent siderophore receptor, partial [Pseudomonas lurida]